MLSRPASICAFQLFASTAIASIGLANVLVVAPSGGNHSQIQAAVSAAASGDILLVRSGTYAPFIVDGKSLTIVADTGASVQVLGTIEIRNLAADQTACLLGIDARGQTSALPSATSGAALWIHSNAGEVRIQDGGYEGAIGYGDGVALPPGGGSCCDYPGRRTGGWDAVRVQGCSGGTVFTRSTMIGGRGREANLACYGCGSNEPGGDGLRVEGARVALYETQAYGGTGERNGHQGGVGGAGLRFVAGSSLTAAFLGGVQGRGGAGGDATDFLAAQGGDGGNGLVLGVGCQAQTLEVGWTGGAGGLDVVNGTTNGFPGSPTVVTGVVFPAAVQRLRMEAPSIARVGQQLTLGFRGAPGESVYLYSARASEFQALPSWRGVLLTELSAAPRARIVGAIPAGGYLQDGWIVPSPGVGVAGRTTYLQAWKREPAGGYTLGEPSVLVQLGAGL